MSHNPSPASAGTPGSPPAGSAKLVVIAAVLALVAIVLVNVYVEYIKRTSDEGEILKFRLTQTLRPGDRLRDRDIEQVRLPARYRDAFKNYLDDKEKDRRLNQMVKRTGYQGEFLSSLMFEDPDDRRLDGEVKEGMRLVALPVNSRTMIGGLRPGMIVDIEAPFRGQGTVPIVLPVMESVKIVTVGNVSTVDEKAGTASRVTSYQTIGIEVTPHAATALSMIDRIAQGPFELHLRKPGDDARVKIPNPELSTGINPAVLDMLPTARTTAVR